MKLICTESIGCWVLCFTQEVVYEGMEGRGGETVEDSAHSPAKLQVRQEQRNESDFFLADVSA